MKNIISLGLFLGISLANLLAQDIATLSAISSCTNIPSGSVPFPKSVTIQK